MGYMSVIRLVAAITASSLSLLWVVAVVIISSHLVFSAGDILSLSSISTLNSLWLNSDTAVSLVLYASLTRGFIIFLSFC